ncbi:hypothetical protein MIR68_006499 [Amoeboaphelidium protococcarum]|nr:hypothetical protein MIR68_006499 [Amoeboaphelidium protococcarum]
MKFIILASVAAALIGTCQAAVMGIDFGTEWIKVGLVKPGIPMDLVLTKDSKRKADAVVTIRDGIRYFGSEGVSQGVKRPKEAYGKLKNLVGRLYNDSLVQQFREGCDNELVEDSLRHTCAFKHKSGASDGQSEQEFSVEELIAMQLAYTRDQVEQFAEEIVRDAVLTVPPFWTQHERQALIDAAELAGIRVLSLMNDETAVALNYASTRQFDDKPQYHIFYDFGAGSTVASLIEFRSIQEKILPKSRMTKNVTSIQVLAMGYDRTLGGHEFDARLQQLLVRKFKEGVGAKLKDDITKDHRAMSKLLREANRVKHILSANTDAQASVEGVFHDIDFKTTVRRAEFENSCQDLLKRIGNPIDQVIQSSNLTLKDIQSFVLVGGGQRVPAVQQGLQRLVGADKIAKHVNADEAAVLGATLRAAQISPQFKVREFSIKDIAAHTIKISYQQQQQSVSTDFSFAEQGKIVQQKLYKAGSLLDSRKRMVFKRDSDFELLLQYDADEEKDQQFGCKEIASIHISGISEALTKYKDEIAEDGDTKSKVVIYLNANDMVSVEDAYLELQLSSSDDAKKQQKGVGDTIRDTVMSLFGGKSDSDGGDDQQDGTSDKIDEQSSDAVKDSEGPMKNADTGKNDTLNGNSTLDNSNKSKLTNSSSSSINSTVKDNAGPKVKIVKLNVTTKALGYIPLDDQQKKKIIDSLAQYKKLETLRVEREDARNKLESFVYSFMDYLDVEHVLQITLDHERDQIRQTLSEVSDWLYDEGDLITTKTNEYADRFNKLMSIKSPIMKKIADIFRQQQARERRQNQPTLTDACQAMEVNVRALDLKCFENEAGS